MCWVDSWFVGCLVINEGSELELRREVRPYVLVDARVSGKGAG